MNYRWTLAAVIAVLSAMLVLPGSALADPGQITDTHNTNCEDGSFSLELHFDGGSDGGDAYVDIEQASFAETPPPAGMTATGTTDPDFVSGGSPDEWDFDNFEDRNDFFTLSGDYDSVDALADDSLDVDYRLEWNGNNDVFQSGNVSINSGSDGDQDPFNDWERCIITYCEDGDFNGGNDYEFKASPTNDCDPVRLCVNGESMTVTEFEAAQLDGDPGSCTPGDAPPPSAAAQTEPEAEEAAAETGEVETVAEVSPAVEVAALPSAGYGTPGSSDAAWLALLGFALLSVGGATVLWVRRS